MLVQNKSGRKLIKYLNISENNIQNYNNLTGAYAILTISGKFLIGYNKQRKQWKFPAGRIEKSETARQAAVRELFEATHQSIENLKFRGLFEVEDANKIIKYQAVYVGVKNTLLPFIHKNNDEFEKIYLWDMKENIGYFDECDKKIVEILFY